MKNINDSVKEISEIKNKIDLIKPDRIDINVPIRPPAESWVKVPDKQVISKLNEIFQDYNNITFPEQGVFLTYTLDFETELLSLIKRHPMRQEQILKSLSISGLNENTIRKLLFNLESERKIKRKLYNDDIFWLIS